MIKEILKHDKIMRKPLADNIYLFIFMSSILSFNLFLEKEKKQTQKEIKTWRHKRFGKHHHVYIIVITTSPNLNK